MVFGLLTTFFMCYVFFLLFKLLLSIYTANSKSSHDNSWNVFFIHISCYLVTTSILLTNACEGENNMDWKFEQERLIFMWVSTYSYIKLQDACAFTQVAQCWFLFWVRSGKMWIWVIQNYSSKQNIMSIITLSKTCLHFYKSHVRLFCLGNMSFSNGLDWIEL